MSAGLVNGLFLEGLCHHDKKKSGKRFRESSAKNINNTITLLQIRLRTLVNL